MTVEEYITYDATGLAELVAGGQVKLSELLDAAIARAEAVNPKVNAIIYQMYDLARQTVEDGVPDGAFAGVPYLLKDLLAAYKGVPMSSGSRALKHWRPDYDSELVTRSKASGLVIMGKTNTPEFGLMGTTEPDEFGSVHNPWDLEMSSGGSSGGSAAAVAAGIVPMASGGDGGGSLRIPAGYCGLFGLKPSRGRMPTGPKLGQSWYGATVEHVLTKSVRDSAKMLDCLHGADAGAPYLITAPEKPYAEEANAPYRKLRIGWATTHPLGGSNAAEVESAIKNTARLLESLGHDVQEVALPYDGDLVKEAYLGLYFGDIAYHLGEISKKIGRKVMHTDIEAATWPLYQVGKRSSALDFATALNRWGGIGRAMGSYFEQYDILLSPVVAGHKLPLGTSKPSGMLLSVIKTLNSLGLGALYKWSGIVEQVAKENLAQAPYTQVANLAGLPAMSVPLETSEDGFPIGSQFMAKIGDDGVLINLAAQLEEAKPWASRRPSI